MNQSSQRTILEADLQSSLRVPETLEVEIFQAGTYGEKGTYTTNDLDHMASSYSPALHEAPVTLDHQQSGPAEGWVSSLRRAGDKLFAGLTRLSPSLRRLIETGAYKKRSVELYRNFNNTGLPQIKAVSFLGAATPEIKGLADPVFADQSYQNTITFGQGTESVSAADTGGVQAEDLRDQLIDQGVWNPVWEAAGFSDVVSALPSENRDQLMAILGSAAAPVQFAESALSPRSSAIADSSDAIEFVGTPSDESLKNHQQAMAFMTEHPTVSYVDALLRTTRT